MAAAKLERTNVPGIFKRRLARDEKGRPLPADKIRYSYVVTFRDPMGKPRKRSARTMAEARDLKASLTADISRGEYRAVAKVAFIEYAIEWIGSYAGRTAKGIRPATRDDYRRSLGLRFAQDENGEPTEELEPTGDGAVAFFGRMPLAAIEPSHLKAYAQHVQGRGVSPNTVRLALAPVKALLAVAYEEGKIRHNPAAGLRLALGKADEAEGEEDVKALTEEELARLLAEIPSRWLLFFDLLAATGLRIGEAIALRWKDIDLGRRVVHVRRRYYRGTFAAPKSKYGRRDVPIPKRLADELELRWLFEEDVDTLVFPSTTGSVIDTGNLARRILKPAARRAGVPWAGFHTFRHTRASTLFRRGVNPKQAQVWLGHHSAAFTLDVYTHLLPGDLPDADALDVFAPDRGNAGGDRPTEISRNDAGADAAETPMEPRPSSVALT